MLITGHTGFKGSWLSIWLHELGAEVVGVALDPSSDKDNFVLSDIGSKIKADIRTDIRLLKNQRDIYKVSAGNCISFSGSTFSSS